MTDKDTSVIPEGPYCYTLVTNDFLGLGRLATDVCPYWRTIKGRDEQADGYCDFLEQGDGDGDIMLLWDQVKECGIKNQWPDE